MAELKKPTGLPSNVISLFRLWASALSSSSPDRSLPCLEAEMLPTMNLLAALYAYFSFHGDYQRCGVHLLQLLCSHWQTTERTSSVHDSSGHLPIPLLFDSPHLYGNRWNPVFRTCGRLCSFCGDQYLYPARTETYEIRLLQQPYFFIFFSTDKKSHPTIPEG